MLRKRPRSSGGINLGDELLVLGRPSVRAEPGPP
jgi:hypothetical protein